MERDNQLSLSSIRKDAVDAQAYRACQLLQALSNLIEHKKLALGYPGQLAIDKACETEAEGLLDSVLVCMSDDPPIPVRQCVAQCDVHEQLDAAGMAELIDLVEQDCQAMFLQAKED